MRRADGERRYALLQAARDSDYVRKVYGGYFNVFVEAFGEEGERWDVFRDIDGEFPDASELRKYHGFVVSGSPHDAHRDELWVLRLCDVVTRSRYPERADALRRVGIREGGRPSRYNGPRRRLLSPSRRVEGCSRRVSVTLSRNHSE